MKTIRTIIADDHSVVRIGLSALLGTEKDIKVVGEAEDGEAAVRKALRLKPDVVVMDLMMPVKDGIAATREIHEKLPEARVLILTTFAAPDGIDSALKAGAAGAILKSAADSELIEAIHTVAAGETALSKELSRSLVANPPAPKLTKRQLEILSHITKGKTNKEIAVLLGIREDSVGEHLTAIFQKLGVSNRAEAVAIVLRKQLLKM